MMEQQRRGLAPNDNNNKRKEREFQKPPSKFIKPSVNQRAVATNKPSFNYRAVATNEPSLQQRAVATNKPAPKNQLLAAGYLAYEFLKNGTLFGEPVRAGAKPVEQSEVVRRNRFAAALIKAEGGVQVPGVVNPTQLTPASQL